MTINPPFYGADTPQSFFDEKLEYGWNLRKLDVSTASPPLSTDATTSPLSPFTENGSHCQPPAGPPATLELCFAPSVARVSFFPALRSSLHPTDCHRSRIKRVVPVPWLLLCNILALAILHLRVLWS